MKVGDKVVCIDNYNYTYKISLDKILTIKFNNNSYMKFDEIDYRYSSNRFITIKEYRKRKLKKLKNLY